MTKSTLYAAVFICLAAVFVSLGATGTAAAAPTIDDVMVTGAGTQIWVVPDVAPSGVPNNRHEIEVSAVPPDTNGLPYGGLEIIEHNGLIRRWPGCELPEPNVAICAKAPPITQPFIVTGTGNDEITVHETNEIGSLYVYGGAGNDTILSDEPAGGQLTKMIFRGQAGKDTITGGPGADHLSGGPGSDKLVGGGGEDRAFYAADDYPFGGGLALPHIISFPIISDTHSPTITADNDGQLKDDGNAQDGSVGHRDTISTDVEDIWGTAGNDTLTGNADPNVLDGGKGDDTLRGGEGADTFRGDAGDDQEWGDGGNDTFGVLGVGTIPDPGADTFYGGSGTDTASYKGRTQAVNLSNDGAADDGNGDDDNPLVPMAQRDNISADVEDLQGGKGDDLIIGNYLPNTLRGDGGQDRMVGGSGNDTSYGEQGDDTLVDGVFDCGSGNDTLDGGQGVDRLYGQCGQDTIYARDPIPGQYAFWVDTIDCGNDVFSQLDALPDRAQTNGNIWYPEPATGCEQLIP